MAVDEIHIIEKNSRFISPLKNEKKEVITFDEEFYNGELIKQIDSDEFWKKRYAYFEKKGTSKLDYFDKVIKPLTSLQNISKNATLFLWFSNTKSSEINLSALLTLLLSYYRKDINYYLITINDAESNLQELMQSKIRLSRNKLLKAQKEWETFVDKTVF